MAKSTKLVAVIMGYLFVFLFQKRKKAPTWPTKKLNFIIADPLSKLNEILSENYKDVHANVRASKMCEPLSIWKSLGKSFCNWHISNCFESSGLTLVSLK